MPEKAPARSPTRTPTRTPEKQPSPEPERVMPPKPLCPDQKGRTVRRIKEPFKK